MTRSWLILAMFCAMPALALEGRVTKPVAFVELARAPMPAAGLDALPKPEAAMWQEYAAGFAELDRDNPSGALAHWQAALPLATGRMSSELRFRIGQELLGGHETQALALWHAIDDPQLLVLATYLEATWFANQKFGCDKAMAASVKLLQLPVPADLPDAATAAESILTACLGDVLEGVAESALPATLPKRAKILEDARKLRIAQTWTASQAALEILRRCQELEPAPPPLVALKGTLQKLYVSEVAGGTGKSRAIPASLFRCVTGHARKVAIPGAVDARTVLQR